ncbi:MAG: deoxyribodipyrimidine photolyase [Epsilonproteobacteria bacterium]|nr:deoxyribodipyrimidine photolyase [Campylobacterota bacterium]|tara:strand:+ start:332 stop:1702 length:1371 start_codon:yes stop_codon:yes gene_type:complete
MEHKVAVHIFRRDLRLQDNTALLHALNNAQTVVPCFIFDKRQVSKNEYKSNNAIQFMITSLKELNKELQDKDSQLYIFYGTAEKIIPKIIKETEATLLTFNKDYTPFALKRDEEITKLCKEHEIECSIHEDALLNKPEDVVKSDGDPYTVFTPYMKNARKSKRVSAPEVNKFRSYYQKKITSAESTSLFTEILKEKNKDIKVQGGREEGLKLLRRATTLDEYQTLRDFPAKDYTTHLSAHHKFGTISVRESYHKLKDANIKGLINELYWRDFFTNITYHFPHVIGKAFREKYNAINWSYSKNNFEKWCKGETGFPIVDAGMRELNTTGYMHNRIRMITASFLVKDLHIDWRWGEKYFAQQLVDYDPAVNNGNWQWAASTGCDAQPYFRIFNPWSQQKKFDEDCEYIKTWIPELQKYTPKEIHNLFKKQPENMKYPKPMVDHSVVSKEALAMFKKVS